MGLDMHLTRRSYVKNWGHKDDKFKVTVKHNGKICPDIKPERIAYIIEEVGYWRKFNALHKWFVDNVQGGVDDCKDYYVTQDKFKELKEILTQIKNSKGEIVDNINLAEKLLPTTTGFFFGDTSYDDFYYQNINHTLELLDEIIGDTKADYYYSSSW